MELSQVQEKLLIKPSRKAQQNVLEKIREVIDRSKARTQDELIRMLNPIIRRWCSYHQGTVTYGIFSRINNETFKALWRWAYRRRPNKGPRWIKARYWKTEGNKKRPKPVRVRKTLTYMRLEPYEGKLSRTVLRGERAG